MKTEGTAEGARNEEGAGFRDSLKANILFSCFYVSRAVSVFYQDFP
mgnify:CR=1 FL=1